MPSKCRWICFQTCYQGVNLNKYFLFTKTFLKTNQKKLNIYIYNVCRCVQRQFEHFAMVGIKPITQHQQQQQPHSNAQTQHQEPQDLLTNPVLPQAGRQPSWPVTTSTSPAAPPSMLTANATPSADGRNTMTPAIQGGVAGSSSGVIGGGWINSRPNSTSIHTPSPTSAPMGQPPGQPLLTTGGPRLPPPLAPTTTHQPPPSSQPPPAYTPPHQQHLSSTGFQTSPHSSS